MVINLKYIEFRQKMKSFPVFSVREIEKQFPGFDSRRLVEWQKKGYIQKLRNRYYYFTDREIDEQFLYYSANRVYRPSYISLESALSYYDFIPEGVFRVLSCSTLKNRKFETTCGTFIYFHLKSALFFGYRLVSWKQYYIAIATPEKALVDYLYLHPDVKNIEDLEALRWNVLAISEKIDRGKLNEYEKYINSPALSKRLSLLRGSLDAKP